MIRLALFLAAALALTACASSQPAPVERRGASAPIEQRVPGGAPPARAAVAQAAQAGPSGEIIVPAGATLYDIAETNQVSLRALINVNRLEPPYALSNGQRLVLPETDTYVVRRGDTLSSIARRNNIQPRSLALLNGIEDEDSIAVGQTLRLPGPARRGLFDFGRSEARTAPAAAAPTRAASRGRSSGFVWPIRGAVLDGFGPKTAGSRNDGINIAARDGESVLAAADGLVVFADSLESYGQLILIEHDDGWVSAYAHNRRLLVAEEQTVTQGQGIAEAGSTGAVDSPQLHFELRRDGAPIDPLTALPAR